MLELHFADAGGPNFDCSKCIPRVKKLRRCEEEREDFSEKDNAGLWPMVVSKGGPGFGFCPGKATWTKSNIELYRLLVIASDTGNLWNAGGLGDQPVWFVELLGWFLPRYNDLRFYSRAKAILGDGSKKVGG